MESPNLRHCRARSQNKGLSQYLRRQFEDWEAGGWQPEPEKGNLGPRDGILYQTVSRLPVVNQVFLGSCTVDIHWESCSQR